MQSSGLRHWLHPVEPSALKNSANSKSVNEVDFKSHDDTTKGLADASGYKKSAIGLAPLAIPQAAAYDSFNGKPKATALSLHSISHGRATPSPAACR